MLDVEAGQISRELLEALGVVDVLAQQSRFVGGNASAGVSPVLPDLVLEVGTEADGASALRFGAFSPLLGECPWLHRSDGGDLVQEGLAGRFGGLGRFGHGSILSSS